MKPNNFKQSSYAARCSYYRILSALVSEESIQNGIIARHSVAPLLFFFFEAWENELIRRWLVPNDPNIIKEKRLMMLVGLLFDKGTVFGGRCYKRTIANQLDHAGVLDGITRPNTIIIYLGIDLPPMLNAEANSIFSDIFEKFYKKTL